MGDRRWISGSREAELHTLILGVGRPGAGGLAVHWRG